MSEEQLYKQKFLRATFLNILWIFVSAQVFIGLVFLNFTILFPQAVPQRVFVIDSAEYIDDIYNYGSGPARIDDTYMKEQFQHPDTVDV